MAQAVNSDVHRLFFCAMKRTTYILALLLAAASCGCPKAITRTEVRRDSIIVSSVEYRDTTIYVPVPSGESKGTALPTDTSRLETDVAVSEAWLADGWLHHTLRNKDTALPFRVTIPRYRYFEGIRYDRAETLTRTEQVERPPTWWQRLRMNGFWVLLATLAFAYRKELVKLIKI